MVELSKIIHKPLLQTDPGWRAHLEVGSGRFFRSTAIGQKGGLPVLFLLNQDIREMLTCPQKKQQVTG